MKSYQQFFAELKRRHVFKVAAVYGVVSFGVLQAADLMLPRLGVPDWTVTFMVALVVLAFPVVLLMAWAFEMTPEGVKRTETATPGEIEDIIAAPALQRWPAGLLALVGVLLLIGSTWWIARRTAPGVEGGAGGEPTDVRLALASDDDSRPSLAVLPFVNMSDDDQQEYFSDGITEEILNTLVGIRELKVAARTSAFAFKGQALDLRAVGDSLGVRYLIEGSVRKAGDQLRITAQLIDAADGTHLWSEQYDRRMDDVFAIQTEIAEAIAEALKVPLGLDNPSDLVNPTGDLEAYDLFLAGRARLRERGPRVTEAIRLFEAAIARDSSWAPAWAGLAEAAEIRLWYLPEGNPDPDTIRAALDQAEDAARRALDLDPRSAPAHVALGNVLRDRFDWDRAEAEYLEALSIDPDYPEAHHQYAELLWTTGRVSEAVRTAGRAAALDPAPIRLNVIGFALLADGREAEALQAFRQGIALDPEGHVPSLRWNLYWTHYQAGRFDQAYETATRISGMSDNLDTWWDEWVDLLEQRDLGAIPDSLRKHLNPEDMLYIGEPDRAAHRLANPPNPAWIGWLYPVWVPRFDSIRDRPAVQEMLREKGLGGVRVQRTPIEERKTPEVLKDAERL